MYEKQPWLSQYGATPVSLEYPDLSMYGLFKKSYKDYSNTDALIFFGKRTKWPVLDQKIINMSRKFAQIGLKKGDMV
ncbi:hypothetical protein, partial [Treponema sp. R8-4-B8]